MSKPVLLGKKTSRNGLKVASVRKRATKKEVPASTVSRHFEGGPYRFYQVEAYRQMDMERSFCACNSLHYCNSFYVTRY